jgi:cytochrome c nitrite reductase small subunit
MQLRSMLLITLGILIGVPTGTSVVTFLFADGLSYLSKNPVACTNCHVMQEQFDSWKSSSHHTVAVCNDCHANGNIVQKYAQKGVNGFLHSWAFTTGRFHEPIEIKEFNRKITRQSCLDCHSKIIEASHFGDASFSEKNCLNCHKEVGHKR